MKSKLFFIIITLLINNGLYSQKFKSKKVNYTYIMYPQVRYDKNINSYYIEENYQAKFLKGKLNTNSEKDMFTKVYSVSNITDENLLHINGLKKTTDEGLKIIINYRSIGDAAELVTKMNKITEGLSKSNNPAILMNKHKYELLFADVKIYNDKLLILSKEFKRKCLYKNEYVQYYMNKTGKKPYAPEDYKIEFKDIEANALYFVNKDIILLKKSIYEYINNNLGFNERKTTLRFYTVKSKKYDYSDMNDLQKKVVEAIKNKNKTELNVCVKKWIEMIKKVDYKNNDSKYNKAIAGKLYINSYSACLVSEDFLTVALLHATILLDLKLLNKSDLIKITELKNEIENIRRNRKINEHRFSSTYLMGGGSK